MLSFPLIYFLLLLKYGTSYVQVVIPLIAINKTATIIHEDILNIG